MPTTEYFGYAVENLGPLTTTFTAAPSCLTDTAKYGIFETSSFYGDDQKFVVFKGGQKCGLESLSSDCVPSADARNSLMSSALNAKDRPQGLVTYYSPASICPKGWTTAGVAESSSAGDKVKATGAFDRGDATTTPGSFQVMDWFKVATEALDPQETMILCCPSDFEIDQYGLCTSNVGTYDPKKFDYISTLCVEYNSIPDWVHVTSFDGSTWDPPLLSQSAFATETSTTIVTLTDAKETKDLSVVNTAAPFVLVHKGHGGSDEGSQDKGSKNEGEDDGKGDDTKNQSGSEDKPTPKGKDGEGAAPSLRVSSALALAIACITFVAWI